MSEIAAVIAVVVALGALWLASHANKHVDSSFDSYGKRLGQTVREAQNAFDQKTNALHEEIRQVQRDLEKIREHERGSAEKINTLTQRIKVVEHDLRDVTSALPPQLLQRIPRKKDDRSA